MQEVIYFTLIAFTLSILIVILNTKLNHKNEKEQIISKMLPGYNCGACGYASCSMMAKEIIKDKKTIEKCRLVKNKDEILKVVGDK